ncbi:hypothetical protein ACLK19_19980 [Escherichia coli]
MSVEYPLLRQSGHEKMVELLHRGKFPLLIHQPSYNLLNRWVDKSGLLDTLPKITAVGLYCLYSSGSGIADRKISQRHSARFTDVS